MKKCRPRGLTILLILGIMMSQMDCEQKAEDLIETLRIQLTRLFPYKELLKEDEFAFEKGLEIQEMTIESTLRSHLPDYRFFKTQLTTCYLEYTFVDVIAAIHIKDHRDVRILKAPTFTPDSPEFLELFYSLRIENVEQRERITEAIAKMFEELTYQGSLEEMESKENRYVFNLYREDVSQNILVFEFDKTGRIIAIRVMKGIGHK